MCCTSCPRFALCREKRTADDYYDAVLRFGNCMYFGACHWTRHREIACRSGDYDTPMFRCNCMTAKRTRRNDERSLPQRFHMVNGPAQVQLVTIQDRVEEGLDGMGLRAARQLLRQGDIRARRSGGTPRRRTTGTHTPAAIANAETVVRAALRTRSGGTEQPLAAPLREPIHGFKRAVHVRCRSRSVSPC